MCLRPLGEEVKRGDTLGGEGGQPGVKVEGPEEKTMKKEISVLNES